MDCADRSGMPYRVSAGRGLLWLMGVGLMFGGSGCSSAQMTAARPSDVLRDYAGALERGDAQRAYDRLSAEARRSITFEAFERMLKELPTERLEVARSLQRVTSDPRVTATVLTEKGEEIELVYEEDGWKLELASLDLYGQTSPKGALRSFVRAYERKRFDVLMRFVPFSKQDGLDAVRLRSAWEGDEKAVMDRHIAAVRAGLGDATLEQVGDRATMTMRSVQAILVREGGVWKIEDFE